MRKGHRRTQSSTLVSNHCASSSLHERSHPPLPQSHQILKLLKTSQDCISAKIIHLERLHPQPDTEFNFEEETASLEEGTPKSTNNHDEKDGKFTFLQG